MPHDSHCHKCTTGPARLGNLVKTVGYARAIPDVVQLELVVVRRQSNKLQIYLNILQILRCK